MPEIQPDDLEVFRLDISQINRHDEMFICCKVCNKSKQDCFRIFRIMSCKIITTMIRHWNWIGRFTGWVSQSYLTANFVHTTLNGNVSGMTDRLPPLAENFERVFSYHVPFLKHKRYKFQPPPSCKYKQLIFLYFEK